jgi:hypothetical protein
MRRKIIEDFAKSNNFSPLDADKWNTIKKKDLMKMVQ